VVVDLVLLFAEKMRQEHVRIFGTGGGFARLDCFATRTPKKTCTKFWRCRVFDLQIAVLMLVQHILFNPCRPTDQQWNHCFKTPKKKNCSAEKRFALMLSGRNITLQVGSSKRLLLSDLSAASHQTQLR
jgi:hypothetical protein